jgi:glycosyltransferase involved in cell wall biosynthesis
VVLPVHNGAATIRNQLDAVLAQSWDRPWEVLIVDNDSTDATPEIAAEYAARHPRVRVVAARARRGLSYARNVGVEHAAAPAVVFCDDDDLVGDGWVAAMGDALRAHPVVACRMDYDRLNDAAQMAGRARFQSTGLETVLGYPVTLGVSGWRTDVWRRLGGNDEALTTAGEDFDMSIRATRELGITPHFEATAVYHIARRAGARETFRQARRYGASHVVLAQRYGGPRPPAVRQLRGALRTALGLLRHAGDLRSPERRVRWARRAGDLLGRIEQSIRSRTLVL